MGFKTIKLKLETGYTFGPNLLLEEKLLDEVALPESQKYDDPIQSYSLTSLVT